MRSDDRKVWISSVEASVLSFFVESHSVCRVQWTCGCALRFFRFPVYAVFTGHALVQEGTYVDHSQTTLSYSDFVEKDDVCSSRNPSDASCSELLPQELVLFAKYDVERAVLGPRPVQNLKAVVVSICVLFSACAFV